MQLEKLREAKDYHIERKEYKEALKYSNDIVENYFDQLCSDDWFKKGLCHFKLDQHEEAVECYSKALEIDSECFSTMSNKAISLLRLDRPDEAFRLFRSALKINPNIGPAWLNIGAYLMGNYDMYELAYDKGVNALRRAVDCCPDFRDAEVYLPSKDAFEKVEEILKLTDNVKDLIDDKILTLGSETRIEASERDDAIEFYNAGNAAAREGRYLESIEHYSKAIELEPNNSQSWCNKGTSLFNLNRIEEALACLDVALSLNPADAIAWINKANALSGLGRYDEAIESLDKALTIDSDRVDAWFNRGVFLMSTRHYEDAIASFNKALEIKPDYEKALRFRELAVEEKEKL